ncbi:PKD domain-containing protein [Thiocapsa bogorovii]|uniref:PKD domain-containing protein n=1 Tax=Thiocapsa bogorovii TaxID=521689 RepID=UPI0038CD970F
MRQPRVTPPSAQSAWSLRFATFFTVFLALLIASTGVYAAEVKLAWDPVDDNRMTGYELHYGEASGQYQSSVNTAETTTIVAALESGKTYYFAVKATAADRSLDSSFSEEVTATIPHEAPQASFNLSGSAGVAPLALSFVDTSTGQVDQWQWTFGDGQTSTERSPNHLYTAPGEYIVSLLVSGPGGLSPRAATARVTVAAPPPVAGFTSSTTNGVAPTLVVFNDASSGDVSQYEWNFGDGGTSTGASAAWTYSAPGTYSVSLKVTGPGGSDSITKTNLISIVGPPPVANFDASERSGDAPLSVTFRDLSAGEITAVHWDFGDGQMSSEKAPTHIYTEPGVYDVSLMVKGPYGSDTSFKSAFVEVIDPNQGLPIEVGEVEVDHNWTWVEFGRDFENPVVVANPPSFNDTAPAVVRIDGVEPTGFWIRIQEWDYLDGIHGFETVNYIAVEKGSHLLPNGDRIEAGTFIQAGRTFHRLGFAEAFAKVPVVLTSVTSAADAKAVTTRVRNVSLNGFELRMDEQESLKKGHGAETISYIAWPPSEGDIDGLQYRVGLTGKSVTDKPFVVKFGAGVVEPPAFLAHPQSTNGGDPTTLRYHDLTAGQVAIRAEEDQSRDVETRHAAESVGWMIFN